ncbi:MULTISPECIES: hypothetical protein [unclassified Streptomyces]|uniref:hypothetical protein n=1 Tax=unclassified Streptomyces TaxID=2593676 RepID=UPI0037F55FCA
MSASRTAFSLGRRGDAPKAFARTSTHGVPRAAILGSVVFGFAAVFCDHTYPDSVFLFVRNASGAIALFVRLVICFLRLRMRRGGCGCGGRDQVVVSVLLALGVIGVAVVRRRVQSGRKDAVTSS